MTGTAGAITATLLDTAPDAGKPTANPCLTFGRVMATALTDDRMVAISMKDGMNASIFDKIDQVELRKKEQKVLRIIKRRERGRGIKRGFMRQIIFFHTFWKAKMQKKSFRERLQSSSRFCRHDDLKHVSKMVFLRSWRF